jgi:hypothetical protein
LSEDASFIDKLLSEKETEKSGLLKELLPDENTNKVQNLQSKLKNLNNLSI